MFRIQAIALLLVLLLASCKSKSPQERFIADNNLEYYDKVYLVACLSCSECMLEYFKHIDTTNAIFVYDSDCRSKFLTPIKSYKHLTIDQAQLDDYFGEFGNVLIVKKKEGGYMLEKYPER